MTANRSLPARPDFEALRKQAKSLLRAARAGDPEARARLGLSRDEDPRLHRAQRALAREYGCESWTELKQRVADLRLVSESLDAQRDALLDLACLTYSGDDRPERRARARRLLERSPALSGYDICTAAACANLPALTAHLERDPEAARRPAGPRDREPLLYVCYAREIQPRGQALPCARLLLERGADPNAHFVLGERYRFTALTGALGDGEAGPRNQPPHPEADALATLLLDAGADPADGQGLYNTCFRPDDRWLRLLIARGLGPDAALNWDPESEVRLFDFLLCHAARVGFGDRVRLLLEAGANPDARDYYDGRPALEHAMRSGEPEIAEALLRAGAAPLEPDPERDFRAAVMAGDFERAEVLRREAPERAQAPDLLVEATDRRRVASVRWLLEHGADPDGVDRNGSAALHMAAMHDDVVAVRVLLDAGANTGLRDAHNQATPLGWAEYGGHERALAALLPHARDPFDLVRFGRLEALRAALAADPALSHRRSPRGATLLFALRDDTPQLEAVAALLLERGVDPEARADSGVTAAEHAATEGHDRVADAIVRER